MSPQTCNYISQFCRNENYHGLSWNPQNISRFRTHHDKYLLPSHRHIFTSYTLLQPKLSYCYRSFHYFNYKIKFSIILFRFAINVKSVIITWLNLQFAKFQAYYEYQVIRKMIYLLVFLVVGTTAELQGRIIMLFQHHKIKFNFISIVIIQVYFS